MDIYDLVVPKDNLLRKINYLIDVSFVYDQLKDKYCYDNGQNAIDPIRMFKYLLLETIYDLSDVDIVDRSIYDMSFMYFLNMAPEELVIEPSSLTKFRKLRLKDINLSDMLINKTVEIAIKMDRSKKSRKAIYKIDESMKKKFPAKNTTDVLEDEVKYC